MLFFFERFVFSICKISQLSHGVFFLSSSELLLSIEHASSTSANIDGTASTFKSLVLFRKIKSLLLKCLWHILNVFKSVSLNVWYFVITSIHFDRRFDSFGILQYELYRLSSWMAEYHNRLFFHYETIQTWTFVHLHRMSLWNLCNCECCNKPFLFYLPFLRISMSKRCRFLKLKRCWWALVLLKEITDIYYGAS